MRGNSSLARVARMIECFGGFFGLVRLGVSYDTPLVVMSADCAIGIPFNTDRRDGCPDRSNLELGRQALVFANNLRRPIYTQREIDKGMRRAGTFYYGNKLEVYDTKPGQWVKSCRLIQWASRMGMPGKDVLIIAHPHHIRRCAAFARFYGLHPRTSSDARLVPYDRLGGQWWCKSPLLYIPWEYLSRAYALVLAFQGKL